MDYKDDNGEWIGFDAEGTGEKMNEDQVTITNALSGNNAAFGWR